MEISELLRELVQRIYLFQFLFLQWFRLSLKFLPSNTIVMSSRLPMTYSNSTRKLPIGKERTMAMARERAALYYSRKKSKKINSSKPLNNSSATYINPEKKNLEVPILNSSEPNEEFINESNIPPFILANKQPNAIVKKSNNTPLKTSSSIKAIKTRDTLINNIPEGCISKTYDMDLAPYFEQIKKEHPRFLPATINGEACELWTYDNLSCRQCGVKNWQQMPRNYPGYDLSCKNCDTKYQIKSTKKGHIKTRKNRCEISGATYAAVSQCHAKYDVDYYLFDIDENQIRNIYYLNNKNICCDTDLKRRKVTKQENIRAGRNGRNYCSFNLDSELCDKIYPFLTVKE